MRAADALIVGCYQALAIAPGLSRSGSTIAGGVFLGFDRQTAARFSFLLSIPVILGAFLLKVGDIGGAFAGGGGLRLPGGCGRGRDIGVRRRILPYALPEEPPLASLRHLHRAPGDPRDRPVARVGGCDGQP